MIQAQVFFQSLEQFGQDTAVTTVLPAKASGQDPSSLEITSTSYQQLQSLINTQCESMAEGLGPTDVATERHFVFIKMHNTLASIVDYLSALQSGIVALLIDPDLDVDKQKVLIDAFNPNAIIDQNEIAFRHGLCSIIDKRVALLLPTSGSTGAIKHVALSYENLSSNAQSICEYLPILPTDKAIANLPVFYSYGLSILNTHLLSGASIVFAPYSIVNREFWKIMDEVQITSLAGVPHTYEMLDKLRFARRELPFLRYLTQAGGKLDASLVTRLCGYAEQTSKQFFVMYGQTEATARMAYCSHQTLVQKPDVIGRSIPNGKFRLENKELLYQGPNVMLGYVDSRSELIGFEPIEWLATGDLAEVDSDGDFKIIGRKKRFVKVFGHRIDLDQVEHLLLAQTIKAYCCGIDGRLIIGFEQQDDIEEQTIKSFIHSQLGVHPTVVSVVSFKSLPLLANGKKDYQSVQQVVLDIPDKSPIKA